MRQKAILANSYAIFYGALDAATIQTLRTYPMVIVHPHNGDITRAQIQAVQQGVSATDASDNVAVLCYISIGEDSRTFQLTDAQLRADPRFVGDGTGPSKDPRGVVAGTLALTGLNALGTPTNGGFASWYLNDNHTYNPTAPANVPDQNPNFLTRYVNAGDPKWYDVINNEKTDDPVPAGFPINPPGLKEILTTSYGRGLGCDGVFLDTVDTAAPNTFDSTVSNFEWTAKGFTDFMQKLRADYPDKVILQNRGVFFFDPRLPHFEVSARGSIDFLLFESYRLNSNSGETFDPFFFPDNKYNYAPKIMAEANRADGFRVLSLGYANGWGGNKPGMDINTLTGGSNVGFGELMTDIQEALSVGFRHYLTNAQVALVNGFVKDNANFTDTTPPQWSSIYNANYGILPAAASAASPRVGVQAATVAGSGITVAWDVALDMNRVRYALYYKTTAFDFAADPNLSTATRVVLTPTAGAGYAQIWNSGSPNLALQNVYPYQQTLTNLAPGATYYFVIRAVDSVGNEEKNQVVRSASL
jgi:hypothetical protein